MQRSFACVRLASRNLGLATHSSCPLSPHVPSLSCLGTSSSIFHSNYPVATLTTFMTGSGSGSLSSSSRTRSSPNSESFVRLPFAAHSLALVRFARKGKNKGKDSGKKPKKVGKKKKSKKAAGDEESLLDDDFLDVAKLNEEMTDAVERMEKYFGTVKVGRASPEVLDPVQVKAFGDMIPLKELGQISSRGANTLVISLYDSSHTEETISAIQSHTEDLNPFLEGKNIMVPFPKVTREVREDLCKQVQKAANDAKGKLRNIRQNTLNKVKKDKRVNDDAMAEVKETVQDLTDRFSDDIDDLLNRKENEINA